MSNDLNTVDNATAEYTSKILPIARKLNIDFEYAGNKGDKRDELTRAMDITYKTAKKIVARKPRGVRSR